MFNSHSSDGYGAPLPGIRQKTLVFGERTLMTEFLLDAGGSLPLHAHPYEQTGYLVSGRMILKVGDDEYEAGPGDSWCIPPDVIHGATVLENTVAVEVFSPVREDYLPCDSASLPADDE